MSTKVTFNTPLTYSDGSTIPAAALAAASYVLEIDTVNPPAKSFPVPAANVAAGVANPDGSKHVTVLFTEAGFTPVPNVTYFVTAQSIVSGQSSVPSSPIAQFSNVVAPNPPTAVSVS